MGVQIGIGISSFEGEIMSLDCIFCKIVAGDMPCVKVFENETVLSFMDINPITRGHALVIPKAHHDPITNVPDELLADVIHGVKKVASAMVKGISADGINVAQANGKIAGQEVWHTHFHVIPRYEDDPHDWKNPLRKYNTDNKINEYCEKIKAVLQG